MSDDVRTSGRSVWLAAALGLLMAGLGYLYVGRRGHAAATLATVLVGSPLVFSLALGSFAGFLLFMALMAAVYLGAAFDAVRLARVPTSVSATSPLEYAAFVVGGVLTSILLTLALRHENPNGEFQNRYRTFIFPTASMQPLLEPGDYFASRRAHREDAVRGRVVVYQKPGVPGLFISRIVAVAGDSVEFTNSVLKLNDQTVPAQEVCLLVGITEAEPAERILKESSKLDARLVVSAARSDVYVTPQDAMIVPDGYVFLLSDNRPNSRDSRVHGVVPVENILGVPLYLLWAQNWRRIGKSLTDPPSDDDARRACESQ